MSDIKKKNRYETHIQKGNQGRKKETMKNVKGDPKKFIQQTLCFFYILQKENPNS